MLAQPIHNKPTPRRGSAPSEKVIAPERGVACEHMDWHYYFVADFDAGILTWKVRAREHFSRERSWKTWNRKNAGKVAGTLMPEGYRLVGLLGSKHSVHRILYEMDRGPIPEGLQIDHIDQNKGNNSRNNLRLATNAENCRNTGMRSTNTSGFKGVSWYRARSKWRADIRYQGRSIYLGSFDTKEQASAAYTAAAINYHGEFAPTY